MQLGLERSVACTQQPSLHGAGKGVQGNAGVSINAWAWNGRGVQCRLEQQGSKVCVPIEQRIVRQGRGYLGKEA